MSKKVFIVTGEPSGDIHASFVVKELRKLIPDIEIAGVGGLAMKNEGVNLFHDHSGMAVVGLDSFKRIPEHVKLAVNILKYLKIGFKADIVLLIDYGGFNLRLAEHLKRNKFKVFYYISPQIWASRRGRLKKIASYVDKMMLILPFEEKIHTKAGVNAEFVGHPLVSQLPPAISKSEFCKTYDLSEETPVVGIFPGSRKSEIKVLLDIFIRTALLMKKKNPEIQFCIAQSNNIADEYFTAFLSKSDPHNELAATILKNANYKLLSAADMLILTSGTVTLEAAIYQKPMILSYKASWITYIIYLLVRYIKHIGLPNIILSKSVIPEFVQHKAQPEIMAECALKLLQDSPERENMLKDLADVNKTLTNKVASARVAEIIVEELGKNS